MRQEEGWVWVSENVGGGWWEKDERVQERDRARGLVVASWVLVVCILNTINK